ncbi:MAG: hypothetical protein GQ547_04525 [Methylophaga sp.]|nr:hypothetical protein [Methylophaga sp.]
MHKMSLIIAGALLLSTSLPSYADVLSIATPSYSTPNSTQGVLRPTRGMTMNDVEQKYGQAESKSGPVGDPAITTWRYPHFSVFFESNIVIHSVVIR